MELTYGRIRIQRGTWGTFPNFPYIIIGRKERDSNECIIACAIEGDNEEYIKDLLNDLPVSSILKMYSAYENRRNREGYVK